MNKLQDTMKSINSVLLLFLSAFTIPTQAQTFHIKGNIQQFDVDSIQIVKIKDSYYIDKIPVHEGQFFYEDSLTEPFFIQILWLEPESKTAKKLAEFIVEEGTIYVEGPEPVFETITVRGSRADQILKEYLSADAKLTEQWDSIYQEYQVFKAAGDTISRKAAAARLNHITFQQRIPLLKEYVQANHDNIVGALIPNFCSLEQVLKEKDYLDMYNLLTESVQATAYGQSLKTRSEGKE